ncbi:MAG: dihydrofolate reductase [Erysipelotrichales bacterium]|nr:dihydrofolate reductase [Erysipelotrichales bacterium]MBR3694141.1 dihydrofolate reductase [Erysipelotrichales bacterium]
MIALIVAMSKNRVIGNNGTIPWNIPGELTRFKELTTNNVVIMGRRTYEDIGRPLPNRENIIVSTTHTYEAENCRTARSLQEAIELAGEQEIYIGGGARLYEEAIPLVDKMYITEVDLEVEGDTFFPCFDESLFIREVEAVYPEYTYVTYTRKKAVM